MKTRARILPLLPLLLLLLAACDDSSQVTYLRPNDSILAFGGTLTHGAATGTADEQSYPKTLAGLISRPVHNGGVAGELSADGVKRLPGALDRYTPELLLLCHGGDDPRGDSGRLKANLRQMVEISRQRGVAVILLAVPHPGLAGEGSDLYRELATELKLPLVEKRLSAVFGDERYRGAGGLLNADGNRQLAEAIADRLALQGAI